LGFPGYGCGRIEEPTNDVEGFTLDAALEPPKTIDELKSEASASLHSEHVEH
jgi:hypothetical protein